MNVRRSLAALVVLVATGAGAQSVASRHVRVAIELRQSAATDRDALRGGGDLVITERGIGGSSARLGAESRTTRVKRSSGIFTVVQDGGESMLSVATRVPVEDVRFYRDYATGAGYVARGVAFENVGTSLEVHADVLPQGRIHLRLVPTVSYFSVDRAGALELVDAATELVVESGKPVTLGGGTSEGEEVTRRIFGYGTRREASESSIVLTATLQ